MALRGSKTAAHTQSVPGFEQSENPAAGQEAPAAAKPAVAAPAKAAPPAAAVAAAGVAAGTAIAKAATTSLIASGKVETVFESLKNAMPAVDFGVLPRLIGSNGNILDGDKKVLGDEIELTLVSWNDNFVVSPGDDTDEAKAAVRYSRDGITVDDTGENVNEYLKQLREVDGYEDANVKNYLELVGILTGSAKDSEHVNNMVQVSMSPQSRKSFEGFRIQETVKIRLGHRTAEGLENLTLKAEIKTFGSNSFTLLKTCVQAPAA